MRAVHAFYDYDNEEMNHHRLSSSSVFAMMMIIIVMMIVKSTLYYMHHPSHIQTQALYDHHTHLYIHRIHSWDCVSLMFVL